MKTTVGKLKQIIKEATMGAQRFGFHGLQQKMSDAARAWEDLVRRNADDEEAEAALLQGSIFWQEDDRLFGEGAQEYTRFVWNSNTHAWLDVEEADEETTGNAEADLQKYADAWELEVVHGEQEIADLMGVDVDMNPPSLTSGAMWNDEHLHYFAAFVTNGRLSRFGLESLGEDPSSVVATTLDELMQLGDPRDLD